jgi:hypothetical protein
LFAAITALLAKVVSGEHLTPLKVMGSLVTLRAVVLAFA